MMVDDRVTKSAVKPSLQQQADVVLVSMPFGPLLPSIGLGLLKASLAPANLSTKVCYFTLRFAQQIGISRYNETTSGEVSVCDLVGEWVFSDALFDSRVQDVENFIEDVLRGRSPTHRGSYPNSKPVSETFIQNVLYIRSLVENFLDECVAEVLSYRPRLVGFTSTFHQHVAALALAKRLKAKAPEVFIEFGGANCQGVMGIETIRQFSFVDAIISGEGDRVFPELVHRVFQNQPVSDLPGVYTRNRIDAIGNYWNLNAPTVHQMDALPIPDYDDYFQEWEKIRPHLSEPYQPRLLIETSRGCWWGEKKHCTFCGLNGTEMTYRSKSGTRALEELLYLIDKYPGYPISVVDNILDMKYFKDLIPEMAARQLDLELFYEVKANLRKEQVRLLKDAGITMIQPGIESFSTHVLELMQKGVRGLQNIQLLKWCKELGVTPFWNLLWGFPGETPEDYSQMANLIPLLTHLRPPKWAGAIRIDRFSPHFDRPEEFGFEEVVPFPAYHYIYPFAPEAVANLAYFFTFKYCQQQDVERYTRRVREEIIAWQSAYETSTLFAVDQGTSLQIWDLRPIAHQLLVTLTEPLKTLYLACDGIRTVNFLHQLLANRFSYAISVQDVAEMLQPLVDRGLLLNEGNSYLSLAVSVGEYSPDKSVLKRLVSQVTQRGHQVSRVNDYCEITN
ncbi:MAG: RiPP maturation radical SAM C-methyltransferase [Coleofasciculus sp. B1-GNL1-01]|uniref:RiPP maturation radical SAM C-methyltransferase n=1 Tax=Coleofasciculus sp. B1-GNL1-01 TaxID=3068484 RepID=UPI0033013570